MVLQLVSQECLTLPANASMEDLVRLLQASEELGLPCTYCQSLYRQVAHHVWSCSWWSSPNRMPSLGDVPSLSTLSPQSIESIERILRSCL
mmetsp:Transcript_12996/g.20427  ORF Transcript_12996/g.20427 Transcript_12996/m.20427 type:complete len:91 (+) Transcript_12996:64-336(+)